MWIRDVDIPRALVEAHQNGKLVIFVGAGASRGSPSDLPDFRQLTRDIAAEAQVAVTDDQLDEPDIFLGDLEDQYDVDVHVRVAARIDVAASQPNQLHQAIAALAAAGPRLRIVTTNYDLHLSEALGAQGDSVPKYMGPALPMGDDFTGLVYLHGCLRQGPRALIVTDADFGQAYLRDAWAARFLERMFATYAVLFIGYSHKDVVMQYLGRALRAESARFVLTSEPDAAHWRRLRIESVGYPLVGGSHDALVDAVDGWASLASMGLLDHRQRIALVLSASPSQIPEETSYLEAVIAEPDKVGFFTEYARGPDWLSWAAGQPEFRRLFDPSAAVTGCTLPLASWFAEHYVMAEDLTDVALSVVREAGALLGPQLWSAIGQCLHARGAPRPTWLGPWLVLLIQNDPELRTNWLDYALVASRWPEDRAAALLLFDHLTEPHVVPHPTFGLNGRTYFDVRLIGDAHWLRRAWETRFAPNLTDAAPDVLVIVDRHLRRAHQLLTTAGTAHPGRDPLNFPRSAIEPHPQDILRDPVDVLIDAGRDCLETLLAGDTTMGLAYLRSWADTDVPLLRRFAVHGWAYRSDVDASAKLDWLRNRRWLFDHQLRHEVFRLVAATVADAEANVADALVADVVAGPDDEYLEHRDYEIHNALAWIVHHAPGLQSARDALEQVKAQHPDFEEPTHPDLTHAWAVTEWARTQPPMTTEALHALIQNDAAAAIAELRRYEQVSSPFSGPTWAGAMRALAETVRDWPVDGFAVLDADGGDQPDILRAVIQGWAAGTVDDDTAASIIDRLTLVDLAAVSDDIARLLAAASQSEAAAPTEWHRIPAARHLAAMVWTTIDGSAPDPDVDDWLGHAINHSAGQLAEFWLQAVAADWRADSESWSGVPPATREQLEVLLTGADERVAMAEVIFASRVLFFYGADRNWCLQWVLPLLDWADPVRARRTWDGFLSWGRSNDHLLTAGLLNQYLQTTAHIGEFRDELRRQLCHHLASIGVYSELDPLDWAPTFTATVNPTTRAEWMDQITWQLRDLPVDTVEHQWQRWMRKYWANRLESIPNQLTDQEASAMASWVVYLRNSIDDGVTFATAQPAELAPHSQLLDDLTAERIAQAPTAVATLITHLLKGTQQPFYECHSLREVVNTLRAQPVTPDVDAIIEQAVRLGCSDASTW